MWCKLGIKVSVAILKRMLPRLRERAKQTGSPIDDVIVEAVDEIVQLAEKGEIERLLCG